MVHSARGWGEHVSADNVENARDYVADRIAETCRGIRVTGTDGCENVAILGWLSERYPEAQLLPRAESGWSRALQVSDLAYCASGLHPLVTRLRIPQFFCDTPDGVDRVFAMAETAMRPNFAWIDQRFAAHQWWYGEQWSIVDAYINWVWFRVTGTKFDASDFPHLARHDKDMNERAAVGRALRIGNEIAAKLEAQGLAVKFTGTGVVGAPSK